MARRTTLGPSWWGSPNTAALGLIIGLAIAMILALAFDVARRLETLASDRSDSVQWSLSQVEIEMQRLHETLGKPVVDLTELRSRFDLLYSRIHILESGRLYTTLREEPDFAVPLSQLTAFGDRGAALMDGPDAALRAATPALGRETSVLRDTARGLSLLGISYFAAEADQQRVAMYSTLQRVAAVTAALIIALCVLITFLLRLYRRDRTQTMENRRTTARLETIVGTSVDAIVVADGKGTVLEFNPAAEQIFGYTRREAIGARAADLLLPPETAAETIRAVETRLIRPMGPQSAKQRIELEAARKDGSRFPVELSVAAASGAEGQIFVAFLRDISDRRQAELDLTEARDQALEGEKAKADFLAVMSHEMRTPLNGLLGSVEILGATPLQPPQRELLDVIETSGQVLLQHVNSVLFLSSAEASQPRQEPAPFVLEALVREVVANQSGLAANGGNTLEVVAVTEPVGRVLGDPARLRQVLMNLVGNAVKFTRNGRIRVEIEAEPPAEDRREVELRVIDTGIGIAEADQARIFDDFVTLDSSYGRETGGTGLGLGITRRLVAVLGGTIGVESEPGAGSVFWVRLPFGVEPAGRPAPGPGEAEGPVAPGLRLSVLVIEDNAINRFVLRTLLEETQHLVAEAVDGLEGVALADAAAFDVILMDISMPRLDGVAAAQRIRQGTGRSRGARIVAVTAHALPAELERFRAAGIDDCLVKPVTRGMLMRALSGQSVPQPLAAASRAGAALLHRSQLQDLAERLGPATTRDMLDRFFGEGDTLVSRLLASPEPAEAAGICHRLAGSAAIFGALRLTETLQAIETACKTDLPAGSAMDSLRELWPQTKAAMAEAQPGLRVPAG